MRNCDTRPVSWKIVQNKALIEAIKKEGFEVYPMWIGLLTWRDNLGYFYGSPALLKEFFYSLFPDISLEKVLLIRQALEEVGLIIVYRVDNSDYILIPKTGSHSKLIGNMANKTNFPIPNRAVITAWEQRFNEVYTPVLKVKVEVEGQVEVEDKGQREQPKQNCDQFISLMEGLKLTTKDQSAILQEWCGGLKARTRCISYEKCRADFKGIIKRAQDQDKKEKIRDFSAYLKKAVDNFLIEGPK